MLEPQAETLGRSLIQLAIPSINAGSQTICTKLDK